MNGITESRVISLIKAFAPPLAYKYTTEGEIVHLAETELTYSEEMGGFLLMSPWAVDIVTGNTYTVNYNGTDYECMAISGPVLGSEYPDGVCFLGNVSAFAGTDIAGSNPDAPFVLVTFYNALGASLGGYGQLMPFDGTAAVTLSVRRHGTQTIIKPLDPDLIERRKITLTVDSEGNVTPDIDFETAWAMDAAALQAAITVKAEGKYAAWSMSSSCAPVGVSKADISDGMLKMITIRYKTDVDYSDGNGIRAETRMIEWEPDSIRLSKYTVSDVPTNLLANNTYYLRWNNGWFAVTLDQLKADLGLT